MNRMHRGTSIVAAAALGVALTLAGCSSPEPTPAELPEPITQLDAAAGDIEQLNWGLPTGEPSTVAPYNAIDYATAGVVSQMCDTLMRLTPEYTIEDNIVTAEQVDPLTLRLTLIADATFWDGTPVTTEDIAYSLQRSAAPDAGVGFLFSRVAGIEATDSSTVTITFTEPDALFLSELAGPAAYVFQRSFTEQAGDAFGTAATGVMCSGPLQFESWQPGSAITLSRFDDYWDASYRAHAASVRFSFLADSGVLTQALTSGDIDGAYEIPASLIPALLQSDEGTVHVGHSTQSLSLAISHPGGVIADVDLRKALMISIDREALASVVYSGAAAPNYTSVAVPTWDPNATDVWEDAYATWEEANAFDLEEAQQLVDESSYDGSDLVITVLSGDDTQSRVAQLIQQQANQIGVSIVINEAQPLEYAQMAYDSAAREGTDLYLSSSFNASPDPLEYVQFVIADGGDYNYSGFFNQEAFDAVAQARSTFDATERSELLVQAQDLWEAEYGSSSILSTYEVSFLNNAYTGATTSFAYMFTPALALIGARE